jgi:molybdopterin synthase sulfur carrier subunit
LITVDLRGGIRKSVGFPQISLEEDGISIDDMIDYIENKYDNSGEIKKNEIMVAINGVDSSILGGGQAKIASGDVVTILTVVHGG